MLVSWSGAVLGLWSNRANAIDAKKKIKHFKLLSSHHWIIASFTPDAVKHCQ